MVCSRVVNGDDLLELGAAAGVFLIGNACKGLANG
jgi:hypothetical protein